MRYPRLYLAAIGLLFAVAVVWFDTFPRSTYSPLEKRELAAFPALSADSLLSGAFTRDVAAWFSDTEPGRDGFMTFSMRIKDLQRLSTGDDAVTFHAAAPAPAAGAAAAPGAGGEDGDTLRSPLADENAKIASAGIIVVGSGEKVRALMAYGGGKTACKGYAEAANRYAETFGPGVRVYLMVVPTSVEFYCPDKARRATRPQRPTIDDAHSRLAPGVRAVDAYKALARHVDEDIYLRTDHHWAPLGAFYAAREFARVAGVPFRELDAYERRVVHRYVGSMYGYSKDISLKHAPEDFVYYVPRGVDYTTTYTDYTIDADYRVVAEGKPHRGAFFQRYRDGSGGAYCTFMGGDTRITRVETSAPGRRRLLILKDSFGNALPGYLFYSFEQIHVVDSRYFTKNMRAYVAEHGITDILFANNIFKACSSATYRNYVRFLSQSGVIVPPAPARPAAAAADSLPAAAPADSL